jgi:hypothetical protein
MLQAVIKMCPVCPPGLRAKWCVQTQHRHAPHVVSSKEVPCFLCYLGFKGYMVKFGSVASSCGWLEDLAGSQ